MSDRAQRSGLTQDSGSTPDAVQRSPGKRSMVERRYEGVQRKGAGRDDAASVHAAADAGIAGGGERLPFMDVIQASFGAHDVSGVRAHTDGAAAAASEQLGATAYAKGNDVAFGATPDLHTAAHEAAHVVQQRAGVHLKGGVGEAGDVYEQHADAVADRVVRGDSAEDLLSSMAGAPAGGGAVQSKAIQFIGQSLDTPLAPGAEAPAHGEEAGKQRKWSPEQYIAMWEQEQGRKMTPEERETIDRGCIGITAVNLEGGGNPLDFAEKIYGTFEQAHAAMVERNRMLDWASNIPIIGTFFASKSRYVMFAKMFWSNQDPDEQKRKKADPNAFKPDPKTGEVDMSGYEYRAQPGFINFDYAFWDEPSKCFWHANHADYGDPDDPMIVLQSTKEKFARGYRDFDRTIYCIAKSNNYNPGLAAIAHARSGGGR